MKHLLLLAILSSIISCSVNKTSQPSELKCEFTDTPIGIDTPTPRLSWNINSTDNSFIQSAYQISVSNDTKEIWNSGKVNSSDMTCIFSSDKLLESYTTYRWKVDVWDGDNRKCVSSDTSSFETAKMGIEGWNAQWITDSNDIDFLPAPMFRKEFKAGSKIKSARAYISGLGYYDMFINGEKVGNNVLDPGFTDFSKRVLYLTHDVTGMLNEGDNAIGVILGNGWYNEQTPAVWQFHIAPWRNRPRFICELHINYTDGSKEIVSTNDNSSWKTGTGPLLYNNLYVGSTYDARKEMNGWNNIGFDDSSWQNVKATVSPASIIQAQLMPSIGESDIIKPISIKQVAENTYLYNMGKNFAGVVRLKINAPEGTRVRIRHGELIDKNGRLDQSNMNMHLRPTNPDEIIQTDVYITKGEGTETFTPPFTYHGFQYVEVDADKPIELTQESIEGVVMHSMVDPIGSFSCSNELLNKIYDASKRSYLSNLYGIPTDCPHREKNGWMADGFMVMEAGILNYDSRNIYAKWVTDMVDAQEDNGDVPGIVPSSGQWDSDWAGPIWDAAIFIVPATLYKYYGDIEPMKVIYPTAKRYLDYLALKREPSGLINHGLGDWLYYKAYTPVDFMTTCYYYDDCKKMAKMASLLGYTEDVTKYESLAEELKSLINKTFFNPADTSYSNKTQLSYALPLHMNIVPEEYKKPLAANLAKAMADNDYSLDFGFIGSQIVPIALSNYGYDDVAYKMYTKTTMPSYGYWIEGGATSLYEAWDYTRNIGDASLNHPSMGSVNAWFIKSLGGINVSEDAIAFEKILIKPSFIDDLKFVKASHKSSKGLITSEWTQDEDQIILRVSIPANTTATVVLPNGETQEIGSGEKVFNVKK